MMKMKRMRKVLALLLAGCMCFGGTIPVSAERENETNSYEVEQTILMSSGSKAYDMPSGDSDLMFITLAEDTSFRWNANGTATKSNEIHLDDYSGKNCYFRFHVMNDGYYGIKHVDKAKSENKSDDYPDGKETGYYVDIDKKSTATGAVLHLWEDDDDEVQNNDHRQFAFYFVKEENGNKFYYIQNKKSGLWVGYEDTDHNGKPSVNDKLIQTDEANRKLWIITNGVVPLSGNEDSELIGYKEDSTTQKDEGTYIEIFKHGELGSVNILGNLIKPYGELHLFEVGTGGKWLIKWNKEYNAYTIYAVRDGEGDSNYVWDLRNQTGTLVHLWKDESKDNNRNTNKLWRFIKQPDGTYKIQNARTGLYVKGSSFDPVLHVGGEGINFDISAIAGMDTEVNFNYSVDWMADIPDDVLLSSVNIPGTHDTGTAAVYEPGIDLNILACCQKYYYGEQLNIGIRSFDVRCEALKDDASLSDVNIVHGDYSWTKCKDRDGSNLTLQSLLDDSVRFLKHHPTETIVMMIKPDAGSVEGLAHALNSFVTGEDTKQYVYDKADIPSMGEARGKIVFIRRFDVDSQKYSAPGLGISLANWDDYSYNDYKYAVEIYNKNNVSVYAQDAFNTFAAMKMPYIEGTMEQTVGDSTRTIPQDAWVFNYTSCAVGTPLELTQVLNPWLYRDNMNDGKGYIDNRRLGMVMLNFVDMPMSKLIYETNNSNSDFYVLKPTAPTKVAVTYGEPLANATLTGQSTNGTWTFEEDTYIPTFEDYQKKKTFKITYTPNDSRFKSTTVEVCITDFYAKEVTATVDDKVMTYGDETPRFTYYFDESQLVGEDNMDQVGIDLAIEAPAYSTSGKLKADSYTIKASSHSQLYHVSFTTGNGTLLVKQKTVGAQWSDTKNLVYTGNPVNVTAALTGVLSGDNCVASVTGGNETQASWNGDISTTPVKYTATATLSGADSSNYRLPSEQSSVDYYIRRAGASDYFFPTQAVMTYGQKLSEATLIGASGEGRFIFVSDDGYGNWTKINDTMPAAGSMSYRMIFIPENQSEEHAVLSTESIPVTVLKKPVLAYADAKSKTYGDATPALTYTFDTNQLANGDTIDSLGLTLSAGAGDNPLCDAGQYKITKSECTSTNYDVTVIPASFTVSKKEAQLVWNGASEYTYSGSPVDVTAAISNLVGSDVCEVNVVGGKRTNAGAYRAIAVSLSNGNYRFTGEAATRIFAYEIKKADPVVTFPTAVTITYGDELDETALEGAGSSVAGTFEIDNPGRLLTVADSGSTYGISFVPQDKKNYNVITAAEKLTVTVNPKTLTVSADRKNKVYGQQTPALTWNMDVSQLVEGDSVEEFAFTLTAGEGNNLNCDAGAYLISLAGIDRQNSNYTIDYKKGVLVVEPRVAEIQWNPRYNIVVGGPGPSAKVTNLINGDECTVIVESDGTAIPSWTTGSETLEDLKIFNAKVVGLDGADCSNYVLLDEDLTVQYLVRRQDSDDFYMPKGAVMTYGKKLSDAWLILASGDGTFTFVDDSGLHRDISDFAPDAAGEYTYTVKFTPTDTTKRPEYADIKLVVRKKKVAAKALPVEKIYGEATNLDFELDESQLVFEDAKQDLKLTLTAVGENGENGDQIKSPAGAYEIVKKACGNNNYDVTVESADLVISPKPVTITWSDVSNLTYTGSPVNVTATAQGILEGDVCDVKVGNGQRTEAGTYYAFAYGLTNSNYCLPEELRLIVREYTIRTANAAGGGTNTDNGGSTDGNTNGNTSGNTNGSTSGSDNSNNTNAPDTSDAAGVTVIWFIVIAAVITGAAGMTVIRRKRRL